MNRTMLRPQVDVPLVVLLDKGPEGKETRNNNGDTEYQYTVNDDSGIIWLPPAARTQLIRTGAQAGDEIQIVKSLRGKNAIWNIQVLADSAEPPAQNTRMAAPRPAYAAAPQPARPSQPANGNGHMHASRPAAAAPEPAPAAPKIGEVMQRALEISARANWTAYQAAKAAGCEIDPPTWEDVRAAGISMFIEHSRNGGSR